MKKNDFKSVQFEFDKDRGSSLVLIIDKEGIDNFDSNKFLKKYYLINPSKDEGEIQSYSYLQSLTTIKKIKAKFSFGFDFVKLKTLGVSQIVDELFDKNFGEVWVSVDKKYLCIADLNSQSEEEVIDSVSQILGDKKIDIEGLLFEVVAF